MNEYSHNYVVRLEASLEAAGMRNGELRFALEKVDPTNPILVKPLGYTRSARLIRLLDSTLEFLDGTITKGDLREAATDYIGYWSEELDKRTERSERAKVARQQAKASGKPVVAA